MVTGKRISIPTVKHKHVEVMEWFTVTLQCDLHTDYPAWFKTPTLLSDGKEALLNQTIHQGRLLWANNKRDLVLTDARPEDKGHYLCVHNRQMGERLNLKVIGKYRFRLLLK